MSFAAPVSNGIFSFAVDSFLRPDLRPQPAPPRDRLRAAGPLPARRLQYPQHAGPRGPLTKAVAKMRLLDAVRGGRLAVPKDIGKIEGDLKKEWKKKDKEARGGGATTATPTASSAKLTAGANRRKRDGEEESAPAPKTTAKKTKATDSTPAKKAESETGRKQAVKSSAKKSEPKKEPEPAPTSTPAPARRSKQTAKCSKGASTAGSRSSQTPVASADPEPARPPRTKQTAICSRGRGSRGGSTASSRGAKPQTPAASTEEPELRRRAEQNKPHVAGYGPNPMGIDYPSDHSGSDGPCDDSDGGRGVPPLGLVNGEYEISFSDLNDWSEYPEDEFNLILGLAGNSMWGAYDFGMFHGIMQLEERPWSSSYKKIPFKFRGRERGEGQMSFGPNCDGWIQFLGDGRICGELHCYGQGRFSGDRISGEETQPPRSVQSMREEWQSYNQVEYDNENRRRWGGW